MDELTRAQERLAATLTRGRLDAARDRSGRSRSRAEKLAGELGVALRLVRTRGLTAAGVPATIAAAAQALEEAMSGGAALELAVEDGHVFVGDVRLNPDAPGLRDLEAELRRHDVHGIVFREALQERHLEVLASTFAHPPAQAMATDVLREAVAQRGPAGVEILGAERGGSGGPATSPPAPPDPVAAARRAVRLLADTYESLAAGGAFDALALRHVVLERVQAPSETSPLWDGTMSAAGEWELHVLRVTELSLLLGSAIGLGAGTLLDLGVAAMLHDVGYAARSQPGDVPPEGGADEASGPPPFERHGAAGVRLLLRQPGFGPAKVLRLGAVLEHHRDHDDARGRPGLFGSILRLAEDYESWLRTGAGRLGPPDALATMVPEAGHLYHPVLLRVFVNLLGRYPPGTLLELEDGRYVRSASLVRSPATFATPLARCLDPRTGKVTDQLVDLAAGPKVRRWLPA